MLVESQGGGDIVEVLPRKEVARMHACMYVCMYVLLITMDVPDGQHMSAQTCGCHGNPVMLPMLARRITNQPPLRVGAFPRAHLHCCCSCSCSAGWECWAVPGGGLAISHVWGRGGWGHAL